MRKFNVSALCACSILLMPSMAITQSYAAAQDVAAASADEVATLKA